MRANAKTNLARRLRRTMTQPEVWLWLRIRGQNDGGVTFRRQHPFGPYILDFYCVKAKLAVEIDGEIHARADHPKRDAARDAWLRGQGVSVHRIAAADVLNDPDEAALGILALALEMIKRQ